MSGTHAQLTFEVTNGLYVITLTAPLSDRVSVYDASDQIAEKLEPTSEPKVVVCFDHIKEVSSAILGTILRIDKQVRLKNGKLRLSGMQSSVYAVFQLTRLDTILDIHESTEEAIQSFI